MTIDHLPDEAITHAGKFHADDVFSAALLRLLRPGIRIRRVLRIPDGYSGLAFDIGWGPFDHHQKGAPVRDNGTPYAAFGLLWRALGASLLGEDGARRFDERFVQPLDLDDNTGCGNLLADAIGAFNPDWDSLEDPDACFEEAVSAAGLLLRKRIEAMRAAQRGFALVREALAAARDGIVHLERFAPWKPVLVPSDAEFLIYPSQRGGFNAQAVPIDEEGGPAKCPFPASWAGKEASELQRLSGIGTLSFCHNGRFLIAAGTREDAERACRAARGEAAREK